MKSLRQENIIYLSVWGLLFASPLLSLYVRSSVDADSAFSWGEVLIVWRRFAIYLLLFAIHDFLLAPLLVRGRRMAYFASVAVMTAVFTLYQCSSHPAPQPHRPTEEPVQCRPPFGEPPSAFGDAGSTPPPPPPPSTFSPPPSTPLPIIGEHDILAVVVLMLLFGANLGIKGYFRSREDRARLARLEHQNLQHQLDYLRYQISPHFFMNTLNNIHALVDIDPEKAKDTILELSKMMRYVLYEGSKPAVPLSREFEFIRHYVALMQLRYTDKVSISLQLPQEVPDYRMPPLILVTFIENAFKHGVSYQHDSFITIKASVAPPQRHLAAAVGSHRLHFSCLNSKAEKPNAEKGGVGLQNVRQRLTLIYGNDYTLHTSNTPDAYAVELTLPLQ